MFSVTQLTFDGVSDEEKKRYAGKSPDEYEGYKPKQTWHIEQGIHDQIEHYNIRRHVGKYSHPQALQPFVPLMEAFARHNFNILVPILRLLAIGLELPEDTFVNQHEWDGESFTTIRFMKYHPRSQDEELKTKKVWLKGHTDFGTITILWSQPVAGLQILSPDEKWRWVRHMDNAVVINAGDALDFLCGGYYPPTRHRVVQPPADQANIPRYGLFFFATTNDDVKLIPHEDSPVLQRVGVKRQFSDDEAPTMEQWRKGRTRSYGKIELKKGNEKGVEEEIISGVVVKHFN
jgi:isopenicillin N synthase-like dioxygenase